MRGCNVRYSADPGVGKAVGRVQDIRFGAARVNCLSDRVADHIGGIARLGESNADHELPRMPPAGSDGRAGAAALMTAAA